MQDASEVRTIKLYDEDAYRTDFEARVLSARYLEDGNGRVCDLVLDRTCFFPEEGGQCPDRGTIAGLPVTNVQIRDGLIHHTVLLKDGPGENAKGTAEGAAEGTAEGSAEGVAEDKQRINAFCLRHGYKYAKTKWTGNHLKWLKDLPLGELQREILNDYLITYETLTDKINRLDNRIEELSIKEEYHDKVNKLRCFVGIKTQEALSLIVETGDFSRFVKENIYSAYIGLTPGEASSSIDINRLSITKAGNKHIRTILVEAAQGICKGRIGFKSKDLVARQKGNDPAVIAYADKANERMRRKYYRMLYKGKQRNTAVTAVARELACFVWGMMTDHIGTETV